MLLRPLGERVRERGMQLAVVLHAQYLCYVLHCMVTIIKYTVAARTAVVQFQDNFATDTHNDPRTKMQWSCSRLASTVESTQSVAVSVTVTFHLESRVYAGGCLKPHSWQTRRSSFDIHSVM